MNKISIRPANDQDTQTLGDMYYEFHELHARGVPSHLRSLGKKDQWERTNFHQALENIFNNDDAQIFLAEIEGKPVGLIEVYVRQDEDNPCIVPHKYMLLQSLMVLEGFRQNGIGKQLVKSAKEWAKRKGATEIRLEVWNFNSEARHFYKKLGFRTIKRGMEAEL